MTQSQLHWAPRYQHWDRRQPIETICNKRRTFILVRVHRMFLGLYEQNHRARMCKTCEILMEPNEPMMNWMRVEVRRLQGGGN